MIDYNNLNPHITPYSNLAIPDRIVGDFDSIRPEIQEYYLKKGVKLLKREDQDTTDLEKCLYVSLEKISETDVQSNGVYKDFQIVVLGASGGRIDHTFSAHSSIYKYLKDYSTDFKNIEIIMISDSSCSVFIRPGLNKIILSSTWHNKQAGYSILAFNGKSEISVEEQIDNGINGNNLSNRSNYKIEKEIKFGEGIFFKKHISPDVNVIKIRETVDTTTGVLFSFTNIFHY